MIEIYVVNSEVVYEYDQEKLFVDLFGRTEDGELERIRVEEAEPYFFVRKSVAEDIVPSDYESITAVDTETEETSLMGDSLGRIVVDHPAAISDYKGHRDGCPQLRENEATPTVKK
jgi:hypothetical protein